MGHPADRIAYFPGDRGHHDSDSFLCRIGGSGGIGISAANCGVTELTIRFNRSEGGVTYSTSMIGRTATVGAAPSALTDAIEPLVGWKTTAAVGGTGGACVVEGEISLSREWALLYCAGTQYASNSYAGGLECTARFSLDHSASTALSGAVAHSKVAVSITLAADAGASVSISMPHFYLSDSPVEIDFGGTYAMTVISGRAVYLDGEGPVSIS